MLEDGFRRNFDRVIFPQQNAINFNVTGNLNEPSNANLSVGYSAQIRLFDGHNYQIGKANYRLRERNLRFNYDNLKYNESVRITNENTRIQDAIQYFETIKLTYNQYKVINKYQMKGSFLNDSLVLKDMTSVERIALLTGIIRNEANLIDAKTALVANIFRIGTVCKMVDTIYKGYLQ